MHIAVVVQDFPPETGAGPARVTELASAWMAAGHRVSVVTAMPSRRIPGQRDGVIPVPYRGRLAMRETWEGIDVMRSWLYTTKRRSFGRTLINNASFALSALAHASLRLRKPDVLISSGPPYLSQLGAAAFAAIRKVPLVLDIRDLWPDYVAEMSIVRSDTLIRGMFSTERWLLRRASAVVVVTDSFRERIAAKGVPTQNITVIPNGVDPARYYPDNNEPLPIAGIDIEPGVLTIGYLGTFGIGQGLQAVIDAARVLHEQGVKSRFLLVGDGPSRHTVEEYLRSNPAPNVSVHLPIPRDQTRAFYNACDIVLVPHASMAVLADTVPSKIFEVMACARPLVAAVRGEAAHIVQTSGGGVVAEPGNGESIAAAIKQIVSLQDTARAEMGAAGRGFVLSNYDRRILAARYLEVLERVAQRKPASLATPERTTC